MGNILTLTDELYNYLLQNSLREPAVAQRLRERTAELSRSSMQLMPDQAQFLAFLVQLMGAKKTLEVGVFTGYSTLWTALALPPDGRIIACDINEEWTSIAKSFWQEAGVGNKIDLRIAPALQSLDQLLASGEAASFDFAFIDADKNNMLAYYERALQLVRTGGLIVFDNTLWKSLVIDPNHNDAETQAIRALNHFVHEDERVSVSLLSIGDGMLLALKR